MKVIQVIYFFIVIAVINACAAINVSPTLVGKWKLTETLADPGDGSGKWRAVSGNSYLTFNSNGTVQSTDVPEYRSYKLLDSVKMEFTLADGRKQIVSYRTEGKALILSPQCIEACGSKYEKVN